jgi:hypothetical protein
LWKRTQIITNSKIVWYEQAMLAYECRLSKMPGHYIRIQICKLSFDWPHILD